VSHDSRRPPDRRTGPAAAPFAVCVGVAWLSVMAMTVGYGLAAGDQAMAEGPSPPTPHAPPPKPPPPGPTPPEPPPPVPTPPEPTPPEPTPPGPTPVVPSVGPDGDVLIVVIATEPLYGTQEADLATLKDELRNLAKQKSRKLAGGDVFVCSRSGLCTLTDWVNKKNNTEQRAEGFARTDFAAGFSIAFAAAEAASRSAGRTLTPAFVWVSTYIPTKADTAGLTGRPVKSAWLVWAGPTAYDQRGCRPANDLFGGNVSSHGPAAEGLGQTLIDTMELGN